MRHYIKRDPIILFHCQNKDVLDVGSTGQTSAYHLWSEQRKVSRSLTGIDVTSSEEAEIVIGDMETYKFNKQFDLIVAGDVIEHVMNQGLFLENVKRHLRPGGKLIITTPNAKWPTVFLRPNPTHVLWHDRYTLAHLLERYGFVIDDFGYYLGNKPRYCRLLRPFIWRQALIAVCSVRS